MSAITAFQYGGGALLILFAAFVVSLWHVSTRPPTETDRRCSAIDDEWTELEDAARQTRPPAARATVQHDAVVLNFPRRLRLVTDDLNAAGEVADRVWPDDGGPKAAA